MSIDPTPQPSPKYETLTFLRCLGPGARASKIWTLDKEGNIITKPYNAQAWFAVQKVSASDIFELGAAIQMREYDPKMLFIRGEPLPSADLEHTRRLKKENRGHAPAFREPEKGRPFVCLDVDNFALPDGLSIVDDTESCIKYFVETLPPYFQNVTRFWQASSSAGMKPGLRVHLWFWLDRPVLDVELKNWATSLELAVDKMLFDPVQVHYVAHPVFKGVDDPFRGKRSGFIKGECDAVSFPIGYKNPQQNKEIIWREKVRGCLRGWERKIIEYPEGEPRHDILNKAAFDIGGYVPRFIGEQEVYDRLCAAALEMRDPFPPDRFDEIRRALKDGMEKPKAPEAEWGTHLLRTNEGAIRNTESNIVAIIRGHPAWVGKIGYNERSLEYCFLSRPPIHPEGLTYPRAITETDAINATLWFAKLHIATSNDRIYRAFIGAGDGHKFDPFRDELEALQWDGMPGLDRMLIDYAGAPDTPYVRLVTAKWVISLVARTLEPGCKADYMLILEGPQGKRKSSFLRLLAGEDYFVDSFPEIGTKDAQLACHGPAVIEIAELDSMYKREITTVKSFLTTQIDKFRPPYERVTRVFKRRSIFAGTTNADGYLKDPSGGRRFLPVPVDNIDLEGFKKARDQILAEAVARYQAGEKWWVEKESDEALARVEQDKRRVEHPWESEIRDYLMLGKDDISDELTVGLGEGALDYLFDEQGKRQFVTLPEIHARLGIPVERRDRASEMAIANCLKALGWAKGPRDRKLGRKSRYEAPEDWHDE